jgi:hypothetical protein
MSYYSHMAAGTLPYLSFLGDFFCESISGFLYVNSTEDSEFPHNVQVTPAKNKSGIPSVRVLNIYPISLEPSRSRRRGPVTSEIESPAPTPPRRTTKCWNDSTRGQCPSENLRRLDLIRQHNSFGFTNESR